MRTLSSLSLGLGLFVFAAGAAARTVADAEGTSVTVPDSPQRVVTLSEIDLDSALALGVKPLGAVNGRGQKAIPHYLSREAAAGLTKELRIVGDLGRPNLEAVISLKPDVILTAPTRPETLALLRKIAPTVVTSLNDEAWPVAFERVARALGREKEAEAFLSRYKREIEEAKQKLAAVSGQTVSIVRWNPNGPAFMYQDSFASLVLRDLGLKRPEAQRVPGRKHSMPASLEALEVIDGDWLFVGTLDPQGDAVEALREIATRPAFQKLGAVKAKRYVTVDGSKWTSVGGPLAALSIVKETVAAIGTAR